MAALPESLHRNLPAGAEAVLSDRKTFLGLPYDHHNDPQRRYCPPRQHTDSPVPTVRAGDLDVSPGVITRVVRPGRRNRPVHPGFQVPATLGYALGR